MSYRIEVCPNNRAGCKDKNCKDAAVKIKKGELRLGTWVEIQEHGSWAWRHWGCVSGEQIQNMQNKIGKGSNGEYRWDALDGWEELEDAPAVQERIKRVINQGFIDPEDFNGDPEMNKPGQKGIHARVTKKNKADAEDEGANEDTSPPAKKPAPFKRGRKMANADADADDKGYGEAEPLAKRARKGAAAAKKTAAADAVPEPPKTVSTRPKRAATKAPIVKDDSEDELVDDEETEEEKPKPPKKKAAPAAKGRRVSKSAPVVKNESDNEEEKPVSKPKPEPVAKKVAAAPKGRRVSKKEDAVAESVETVPEVAETEVEEQEVEESVVKPKRGRKIKATMAAPAPAPPVKKPAGRKAAA